MIENKSMRLAQGFPPAQNYLAPDSNNASVYKPNTIENFKRVPTSIDREKQNPIRSPMGRISREKTIFEGGKRQERKSEKGILHHQSVLNNSLDRNENQIQNKKIVGHHVNLNKDANIIFREQEVNRNDSFQQSFTVGILQVKEIGQKLQNINNNMRKIEKRIIRLQRNGNSSSENIQNQNHLCSSFKIVTDKNEKDQNEKWNQIRQQLVHLKEELKQQIKWSDMDKIVVDKIKEHSEITKVSESIVSIGVSPEENFSNFKKEMESFTLEIDEKIKKNSQIMHKQFLKLQQEIKLNPALLSPTFKSSAIKCSGTAILLRFVESFKVRKNCTKKGEAKIVLTDNTYYIDSEGYVLDKDQHYLIDSLGKQLKLEEKHLKLLRQQQILQ